MIDRIKTLRFFRAAAAVAFVAVMMTVSVAAGMFVLAVIARFLVYCVHGCISGRK